MMGTSLKHLRIVEKTGEGVPPDRRHRVLVSGGLIVLILGLGVAAVYLVHDSRVRRARTVLLPEVSRLVERQKFASAFLVAREAERYAPAEVAKLRQESWPLMTIETAPPGADVSMRDSISAETDWQAVGRTPVVNLRLPVASYRWKFSKPGYRTVEATSGPSRTLFRRLEREGAPLGMARP
jgi:hypothetical protein